VTQYRDSLRYWFVAALVSLAFIHLFFFVRIPLNIVLDSPGDHASTLPQLTMTLSILGLCSLVVLVPIVFLAGKRIRDVAAALLIALAIGYWVIDSFLARSYPALDGTLSQLEPDTLRLALELVVVVALFGSLHLFPRVVKTQALVFLGVLLVTNLLWVVLYVGASTPSAEQREQGLTAADLFTLSTRQSLLIVLMDTFQSDYLQDLLDRDPALAGKLEGFVYFPDTLGVAPSTFLSLPAIHSGLGYDPKDTMAGYFDVAIRKSSVLTSLARSGYETVLLNPIRALCPEQVGCIGRDTLLRGQLATNLGEALYLLDISLMRSVPEFLKNVVLNQGKFLLGPLYSPGSLTGDARIAWDDSRLLGLFAGSIQPDTERPHATFLHLMNTHPPYVLDEECKAVAGDREFNRESALQQAACAMRQFSALLDGLRKNAVYDNTLIILLGDHGSSSVLARENMASNRVETGPAMNIGFARLVGSANPVLLIKAPKAHGSFRQDLRPAELTDLPNTICTALGACQWQTGLDLLSDRFASLRPRHFMSYTWEHRFWDLGYIPNADFYAVTGPLAEQASWEKDRRALRTTPIGGLEFSEKDDPRVFGAGWGAVEPGARVRGKRWAVSRQAELMLDLEADLPERSAYRLSFEVYVPDFIEKQAVTLRFNGRQIARRELGSGLHTVNFRIPVDVVSAGQDNVSLEFDVAMAPPGEDLRPLAASFSSLAIDLVELTEK
jgi:uncharacterized membrane protein YhaH (DUF805 family)